MCPPRRTPPAIGCRHDRTTGSTWAQRALSAASWCENICRVLRLSDVYPPPAGGRHGDATATKFHDDRRPKPVSEGYRGHSRSRTEHGTEIVATRHSPWRRHNGSVHSEKAWLEGRPILGRSRRFDPPACRPSVGLQRRAGNQAFDALLGTRQQGGPARRAASGGLGHLLDGAAVVNFQQAAGNRAVSELMAVQRKASCGCGGTCGGCSSNDRDESVS